MVRYEQKAPGTSSAGPSAQETAKRQVSGERLVQVVPKGERLPLDRATRLLFELSWDKARSAVQKGKVKVNGVVTLSATVFVNPGSELEYTPHAPRPHVADRMQLQEHAILLVDHAVLVVNKPAGVITVPFGDEDPNEAKKTLDSMLREVLAKQQKSRGGPAGRAPLGIVHRLDKETSGVMVFTRSLDAKKHLTQQFREHSVERRYLAIVHGVMTRPLDIKSYLLEDRGDGLRGSARGRIKAGQLAITHVTPKQALRGATLVECQLETGRTHQIRIHLSEAGHPIVGERVYIRDYRGTHLEAPRIMLHAATLGFVHPISGEVVQFHVEPPEDMATRITQLT